MKCIASALLLASFIAISNCQYGSKGNIELLKIEKCPVDNPNADDVLQTGFELLNINGKKSFNGNLTLKIPLDESFTFVANVDIKGGINFDFEGIFCKDIDDYIPGIWDRVTSIVGVDKKCPIPEGNYRLTNFEIPQGEQVFLVYLFGHIEIHIKIFKDAKPVACAVFELIATEI